MKKALVLSLIAAVAVQPLFAAKETDTDSIVFLISAYVERTDNRNHVSGHDPEDPLAGMSYKKQGSYKIGIGPGVELKHRTRKTEISLDYQLMYIWWDDSEIGQVESEITHDFNLVLKYLSGERYDIVLSDHLKYNDDPDLYEGSRFDVPESTERILRTSQAYFENTARAKLNYRLHQRLHSSVDGYWRVRRYSKKEIAQRGDEDEYGINLRVYFQQTPFLSYGVYVGHTWFDRETERTLLDGEKMPMGLEWTSVGVSGSYRFAEDLSITARYGYQHVTYENDEIDSRDYPTDMSVELRYEPVRRAVLLVGGHLTIREGYDYPYVDQEQRSIYGSFSYKHTARISTSYRAEYRVSEYEERYTNPLTRDELYEADVRQMPRGGRDGSRDELFLRCGINYRWSENLILSGYYSYRDVDSEVSESYSENIFGVRGSLRF